MRNLRELYLLLAAILVGTAKSLEDKKFGLRDIGNYVQAFLLGEPAIEGISEIPIELANATAAEKAAEVASLNQQLGTTFGTEDAADIAAILGGVQATVAVVTRRSQKALTGKLAAMLNDGTLKLANEEVNIKTTPWCSSSVGTLLDSYSEEEG